ncbi:hypothetical protein [Devosia sp.]|uniref:hypothetical protein n=1 Tax=Devosia sp. TaxID=1871048 RepID=UPI001ACCC21B|nr:hypothetical protein [Devosia sp.]MBN9333855.1 hypothetical protein [Devosia sp.]
MVRALDVDTQNAIRDRRAVVPRNFVLVTAAKSDGSGTEVFGFTDFGEDISTNIIDGRTGAEVNHTFYGDNSPILGIDSIALKIGLEVVTTQVLLNPLHPAVELMARGHNLRNAPVQIHRGWLSPESFLLVAPPRCRRFGQVNGAPINTAATGGMSRLSLKVVSTTRELTKLNPAMRGHETQVRRGNDQARKYNGTAYLWQSYWGQSR